MKIFITGGTGFFGRWLIHTFKHFLKHPPQALNTKDFKIYLLTRSPEKIRALLPRYSFLIPVQGDIRIFDFVRENIDYVIHGAMPSNYARISPSEILDIGINGTKRVLDFSKAWEVKKILFISSGLVYGKVPYKKKICEENKGVWPFSLNHPKTSYMEAKRVGEILVSDYGEKYNLPYNIARCFSFIGPFQNLTTGSPAVSFLKSVLNKREITILGDGKKVMSFMYGRDLGEWLWKILFSGKPGEIYNVGSEKGITIKELAEVFKKVSESLLGYVPQIKILKKVKDPIEWYVPDVSKAKKELGLEEETDLFSAIKKTIRFYQIFHSVFPELQS